jgi:GNAT superfamily N-acetyltransferase
MRDLRLRDLKIDPLGEHLDLITRTVDWQLPEFDPRGDRSRWVRARTEEARLRGVPCAWVAFDGGVPIGCVSLIAKNMETRPELIPWLAALFVLPEHRGRGVGSALVRRCEAEAAASGSETLYLYTAGARDSTDVSGGSRSSRSSTRGSG